MIHFFAALNFLTATGKGDIYLVAVGVFLGNLAWGVLLGIARWSMARGKNRELEETIIKALVGSEAAAAASRAPMPPVP